MAFDRQKDLRYSEMMRKSQGGDKVVYNSLLKEISPIIAGFIYNKIGARSDNDDILQEVLIGIHRSGHTYNSDRSFANWMFAIANFKVKDFLRSYYRKKSLIEVDFDKVEDFIASDVTNGGSSGELLCELIDNLPEKQRKILHLMKIEGYGAKEVAKIMDMSVSAVKVAAHRSYKKLINDNKKLNG